MPSDVNNRYGHATFPKTFCYFLLLQSRAFAFGKEKRVIFSDEKEVVS